MNKILTNVAQQVDANFVQIPKVAADNATLASILSAAFIAIGGIAILYLVIGAFKYVTSGGESSKIAKAKDTILYAVIGIVVSVSAFTIVQFVLGSIF